MNTTPTTTVPAPSQDTGPADWLSPNECAALLGVHPQTIYKAIRGRTLVHHKLQFTGTGARGIVRVRRSDLDAWIESGRVAAAGGR